MNPLLSFIFGPLKKPNKVVSFLRRMSSLRPILPSVKTPLKRSMGRSEEDLFRFKAWLDTNSFKPNGGFMPHLKKIMQNSEIPNYSKANFHKQPKDGYKLVFLLFFFSFERRTTQGWLQALDFLFFFHSKYLRNPGSSSAMINQNRLNPPHHRHYLLRCLHFKRKKWTRSPVI